MRQTKKFKDSWSAYTFKTGIRTDAFKQYLEDRGFYFEPSQDGAYTHFEVKNADEAVDRRANEIVRQLRDSKLSYNNKNFRVLYSDYEDYDVAEEAYFNTEKEARTFANKIKTKGKYVANVERLERNKWGGIETGYKVKDSSYYTSGARYGNLYKTSDDGTIQVGWDSPSDKRFDIQTLKKEGWKIISEWKLDRGINDPFRAELKPVEKKVKDANDDEAILEELATYLNDYYEEDGLEITIEYDEGVPTLACENYLSNEEQISLEEVSTSWLEEKLPRLRYRDLSISTENNCFYLKL